MTDIRSKQKDPLLKLSEVLVELCISRSTFDGWREVGLAPECIKLPNGQLRIRQSALQTWLENRVESKKAS